jgi:hypothetical protein
MRHLNYVMAIAFVGALAGCADPYYPRYGYSQGYAYPSSSYYPPPTRYSYYPSSSYSSPPGYAYRSSAWDRNYNGIHPGPERTFP